MSDDNGAIETAQRLRELVETADLSRADRFLAEQCHRRLTQPLRMAVFGTSPRHAISLINLMIGQSVISPSIERVRVQFLHGETAHARVQYRDGSQKRLEGQEFRQLFEGNPVRVRVYVDLPVLKKLSIMVAAERDADALCADADKALPASDVALFAGAELEPPIHAVWQNLPDLLRDHSYLVLSPRMEIDSWRDIADEFVEVLQVDPRRAQEAKSAANGVDKTSFRESGGAHLVRTIKKEIDILVQAALDGGSVLLARYADQNEPAGEDVTADAERADAEDADTTATSDVVGRDTAEPTLTDAELDELALAEALREQVYSVPLGKMASRSRLLGTPSKAPASKITQRTVSLAMKNMPKKVSRPVSTTSTRVRTRSRKSGPSATPWSLGL